MSHYHCEIVMPPTEDIETAVRLIMAPFSEHLEGDVDEDGEGGHNCNSFWDFWVIGGRWAGDKFVAQFPKERVDEFHEWLQAEGVTVSGLQWGKQELSPRDQIGKVDAKWNEMFPSDKLIPCPLFNHSNDQLGEGLDGTLPGDVMRLADVPDELTCARVIVAGPGYQENDPIRACFMLTDDHWNGLNWQKTGWDGRMASAVEAYREHAKHWADDYRAAHEPKDDWLVVTVDYHS